MAELPEITWQSAVDALASTLVEHGHKPPFGLLINGFDQGQLEALLGFRIRKPEIAGDFFGVNLRLVNECYIGSISTPDGDVVIVTHGLFPRDQMLMAPLDRLEELLEDLAANEADQINDTRPL